MVCEICRENEGSLYEFEYRTRGVRLLVNLCLRCTNRIRAAKVPSHIPKEQIVKYVLTKEATNV